jgi:hypothetical protein
MMFLFRYTHQNFRVLIISLTHSTRRSNLILLNVLKTKTNGSSFLPNPPRFPEQNCLLAGSQTAPVCPIRKGNTWVKMSMEHDGKILTGENRSTLRKTCPNGALSTTNLTWIGFGLNPGLRGGTSVTNRLIRDTALKWSWIYFKIKFVLRSKHTRSRV